MNTNDDVRSPRGRLAPGIAMRCLPYLVCVSGFLAMSVVVCAQSVTNISLMAEGFTSPSGLSLSPTRSLYVSDAIEGSIYRIGTNGLVTLEVVGFEAPRDMIFDRRGNLYVVDSAAQTVYRMTSSGEIETVISDLRNPCCLGFDAAGNLLVSHDLPEASLESIYVGAISRVLATGQLESIADGFLSPHGLLLDSTGSIVVAAEGYARGNELSGTGLYRIQPSGRVVQFIDLDGIVPRNLGIGPLGNYVFASTSEGEGAVYSVGPEGDMRPLLLGLVNPQALAIGSGSLYVADTDLGEVWQAQFGDDSAGPSTTASGIEFHGGQPDVAQPDRSASSTQPTHPGKPRKENEWGYSGPPDYSKIPFTPEGNPQATDGSTSLFGRVLRTDYYPIKGATVRIGHKATRTNSDGYYLLTGLEAGPRLILFDGRSADYGETHYPIAMMSWELEPGVLNELPYVTYFPVLDSAHTTVIDPRKDTVHTTPLMPGVEIHIPRGTKITSIDGTPVTSITTTLVPHEKPMYPINIAPDFGGHFTIQPGGAVSSKPIKVVYSNPTNLRPGSRVELWQYDPTLHGGWHAYGTGTVSRTGQQVIPDRGATFTKFGCGLPGTSPVPPTSCPLPRSDPVDMANGIFNETWTDLAIRGFMPLILSRSYRNQNDNIGSFGVGSMHSFDYRLYGSTVFPGPGAYIDFTTPSSSSYRFVYSTNSPEYTYICTNDWRYTGAKIYQVRIQNYPTGLWNYFVHLKDGTMYGFDGEGRFRELRDVNHNSISIDRSQNFPYNISRVTQPSGRFLSFRYNGNNLITNVTDSAARSVSYFYDGSQRMTNFVDILGRSTSYAWTNNNMRTVTLPNAVQMVENTFGVSNRVTRQVFADGGAVDMSYTTNANGRVTQVVITNQLGNFRTYGITLGTGQAGYMGSLTDENGETTSYARDPSDFKVTSITDPLSRVTSFAYDGTANLTAITNAQGKVTRFTYGTAFHRVTSIIDPLNRTNSFSYDARGNVTSITDAVGKVTTIAYNQFGLPTSVTDPLNNTYTYTYNETLDLATVTDPLGNTVTRSVDSLGRVSAMADPMGRTTKIEYGDLLSCGSCGSAVIDLPATITDTLGGVTRFRYDAVGNVTNIVDALDQTVVYAYDSRNRVTTRTDQLGNSETYQYDLAGNLTNYVDRRGISAGIQYDARNSRTNISYGAEGLFVVYRDVVRRITNLTDSITGTLSYTFDSLDRVIQEASPQGTNNYSYNGLGLRTNMVVQGQTPVTYFYDSANRLTNVVQGSSSVSLFYDDNGRRTKLTLPNGINVLYSYDSVSRPTNITYQGAATNHIDYAYWNDGNRAFQESTLAAYLLPLAVASASYNAANQQLTFGDYTIRYDLNGNVTNIVNGTTTNFFNWGARNQLTNVAGSLSASYSYDGAGRRITYSVSSATQKYHYDGVDILLEDHVTNSTTVSYLRGPFIDEIWQRTENGTNQVYLLDALRNVSALTDADKVITTEYNYTPFGITTSSESSTTNRYKFNAREHDGADLYFYRSRYYHSGMARFISEDPIGFYGRSINLYSYVRNNPINRTDAMGTFFGLDDIFTGPFDELIALGGCAALGGVAVYAIINAPAHSSAYSKTWDPTGGIGNFVGSFNMRVTECDDDDADQCYRPKTRDKVRDKLPPDKQMGGEDTDPFKGQGPEKGTDEYDRQRRELEDEKGSAGMGGAGNVEDIK